MLRLAFLISGSGTTLENVLSCIERGVLDARVAVVVSSRADAAGLEKARRRNLPAEVVAWRDHRRDVEAFSAAITEKIRPHAPGLVCLGGFLHLYRVPPEYAGRVMNIHPALLPAFGGKGFHGMRVHRAVIESGAKTSGCTVHFADNEYDHGPIILQRKVEVRPGDTPETLQARVFAEECIAYPEAIRLFAEGRLRVEGGRVKIVT